MSNDVLNRYIVQTVPARLVKIYDYNMSPVYQELQQIAREGRLKEEFPDVAVGGKRLKAERLYDDVDDLEKNAVKFRTDRRGRFILKTSREAREVLSHFNKVHMMAAGQTQPGETLDIKEPMKKIVANRAELDEMSAPLLEAGSKAEQDEWDRVYGKKENKVATDTPEAPKRKAGRPRKIETS